MSRYTGMTEARRRANRNYYKRNRARLCAAEKKRYWDRKLAQAAT